MYFTKQVASNIKNQKVHQLFIKEFKHIDLLTDQDIDEFKIDWMDSFKNLKKIIEEAKKESVNFADVNL